MQRRHLLLPALAALLALLAWEWRPIASQAGRAADRKPDARALSPQPHIGLDRLARVVLARPVLSATRRAAATAEQPAVHASVLPRLAGILITPQRRAAFFSTAQLQVLTRDQGQTVGEYLVEQVEPTSVTLRMAGREIVLPVSPSVTAHMTLQDRPPAAARSATRTLDGQHEE